MAPEELAATMTRPQRKGLRRASRGQSLSRTQSADLHEMKLLRAGQLTRRGHLTLNALHHYEGAPMTDRLREIATIEAQEHLLGFEFLILAENYDTLTEDEMGEVYRLITTGKVVLND